MVVNNPIIRPCFLGGALTSLTSFIVGYIATSSATDQHPLELFMQSEGVYPCKLYWLGSTKHPPKKQLDNFIVMLNLFVWVQSPKKHTYLQNKKTCSWNQPRSIPVVICEPVSSRQASMSLVQWLESSAWTHGTGFSQTRNTKKKKTLQNSVGFTQ